MENELINKYREYVEELNVKINNLEIMMNTPGYIYVRDDMQKITKLLVHRNQVLQEMTRITNQMNEDFRILRKMKFLEGR